MTGSIRGEPGERSERSDSWTWPHLLVPGHGAHEGCPQGGLHTGDQPQHAAVPVDHVGQHHPGQTDRAQDAAGQELSVHGQVSLLPVVVMEAANAVNHSRDLPHLLHCRLAELLVVLSVREVEREHQDILRLEVSVSPGVQAVGLGLLQSRLGPGGDDEPGPVLGSSHGQCGTQTSGGSSDPDHFP